MYLAYELKKDVEEVIGMGHEKIAWWMAFFKYKAELEEPKKKPKRLTTPRVKQGNIGAGEK